jgi:hypothetical protein
MNHLNKPVNVPDFETTAQMLEFAKENPTTLRTHWRKYYVRARTGSTFRYAGGKLETNASISKPIPCPHFIYPYTICLVEMLAYKQKTPNSTHTMIFCIEDAWKLGDDKVFSTIAEYFGYTLHDHLVEQSVKHLGVKLSLGAEIEFITDYLSPKFKFAYARYVVEHSARGLLNKELFK